LTGKPVSTFFDSIPRDRGRTLSITAAQIENKWLIRIDGEAAISCSNELKQALLDAVLSGTEVQLDLATVTEIDMTAIQLILATARECKKAGQDFSFSAAAPSNVREAFLEAGVRISPLWEPSTPAMECTDD
jgi:anti-anti-sigma regulatory factor